MFRMYMKGVKMKKYLYLNFKTRKQLIDMCIEQKKIIKFLEDRVVELQASNKYKVKSFADLIKDSVAEMVKRDKENLIKEAEQILREEK